MGINVAKQGWGGWKVDPKAALSGATQALNQIGDRAHAHVKQVMPGQTGLKKRTVSKALKKKRASSGSPTYEIKSAGGNIRLKYFGARETRAGVSAAPWNQRHVFPGTFTRGGRFPARVPLNLGGHVYARAGSKRLPIKVQRSGLFIPDEMISKAAYGAFQGEVGHLDVEVLNGMAGKIGF
ncbi:hypothetical protein [Methylobacterium sp. WSM2598]|uniref:hypothetical protein n=1 Tax=Methylobacterium sp. WSM2598 TaxID=398261 RepID=UPI0003613727|nr:hypothetical protein [Methylobacterium sp. WSM2598]